MKVLKRILLCLVSIVLVFLFCINTYGDTIYTIDGYSYVESAKGLASIVGWDNRSDTLVIPDRIGDLYVSGIADNAFKNDDYIKTVDLFQASRLFEIGMFAFSGSALDGYLAIPTNITTVGTGAFEKCTSLTVLSFSSFGGIVPTQCFRGCTNLREVNLTSFITTIQQYAFSDCPNLSMVTIPKSVNSINRSAFMDSPNVVIRCYYGSYAAQFAEENGMSYEIIDSENIPTEPATQEPTHQTVDVTFILGDADGDGFITILDATKVQRVLADLDDDIDGMITLRAAVDGDVLNIMHATKIQRYLAEFEVAEPIGEEVTRQIEI